MPHLCEMMRRLTSKDMGNKKKIQHDSPPDFRVISLKTPLSENGAPASTIRRNSNIQTAASVVSKRSFVVAPHPPVAVGSSNLSGRAEAELVLLERFRSDIQKRMRSIVSNNNNKNSFQNTAFQIKRNAAANLSATMMAMQNMGQMRFNPRLNAIDAALMRRQRMVSRLFLARSDRHQQALGSCGFW
jgi:hypothetical protein